MGSLVLAERLTSAQQRRSLKALKMEGCVLHAEVAAVRPPMHVKEPIENPC